MPIRVSDQVGPYQITGLIGKGGMGEVYRARDTKLNRDAAIKVLPANFASDSHGVSRFRHEAQILASLNHPHIASIYGLEEKNGDLALALEFVEGEDLAEHLKRGPIQLEEALAIAKQIAQGLEAAHEKNIVHRDLKPANIKLTKDGRVKILDFGLAKAFEGDEPPRDSGLSQSPTMAHHMTEAGMIMGTAAYMSPEQARGKTVDKRADIWAFGVVLFEMLTGRRLFDGETVSDTLAAVLTREPDFGLLPTSTPAGVRRLLQRCLNRDPKKRLRDIGDASADLELTNDAASVTQQTRQRKPLWLVLPWIVATFGIAISGWFAWRSSHQEASHDVIYLDFSYPLNVEPTAGLQGGFALSADGKKIAMIGVKEGVRKLYVRSLERQDAEEIEDSSGVNEASFSPDSKSIAFIPGTTTLTRFSLANKERKVMATGADLAGVTAFGPNDIVFVRGGALWIVPAQGGTARQLTTHDSARHEVLHTDPLFLPESNKILFSSLTTEVDTERIESVSLDGRQRSVVIERAVSPVWSPTGHLLFGRDGAMWAVPFNPKTARTMGEAVQIVPAGTIAMVRMGSLGFQLSSNGTLVYVPFDFDYKRAMSVGRDGSEIAINLPANRYGNPRISPDGKRLLVENAGSIIETLDLLRGTRARLVAAALGTSFSCWTADGEAVVFRRFNVPFWCAADGSGKSGQLAGGVVNDFPSSPGPDPDSIITVRVQPKTSGDIFLMSITGKFAPKPLIVTPAYEGGAELSPNGQWLLYQSNQSGQPEIYVRKYPALDREWQVSEGGGVQPRWERMNHEIYYRNGRQLIAVTFDGSASEPSFGKPTALFSDEYDFGQGLSIPNYDVAPDGRFIMFRRATQRNNLRVALNWTEELKRILAAGGTH